MQYFFTLLPITLLIAACANITEERLETRLGVQYQESEEVTVFNERPFEALADIVEEMRDGNAIVIPLYRITPRSPFANADGYRFTINAGVVDFYIYDRDVIAQQAVSFISDDGNVVNQLHMNWSGTPHFFYEDQVIALYLGNDPDVLRPLLDTMGPQVAGSNIAVDTNVVIERESMVLPEAE